MKLPRDISGPALCKLLGTLGYVITRQTGSHIRLSKRENPQYHITILNHPDLKIGTLNNILIDVAEHHKIMKEELIGQLFH